MTTRGRAWRIAREPRVLLGLAIVLQVFIFIVARRDVPVDDALAYTENAHAIRLDPIAYFDAPPDHPFAMRVGITLPLAALIGLFGVSQTTTNLLSLIGSIALLLVVYAVAPTDRAKRIGIGFTALSSLIVAQGTELNADLLCGVATAASLLLLSRRRIAAAVAVWFFAFLVKETTIWFAPAWLYVIVVDARTLGYRATARLFMPAVIVGVLLVAGYLAVCAHVWGDPLARMHGIDAIADQHPWKPHDDAGWWVRRLVWGPPVRYTLAFGIALLVALAGARRARTSDRVWVVAAASYLLLFWFGSASSTAYVPLPLDQPRMLLAVLPCVLVVATLAGDALSWRRSVAAIVAAVVVAQFGFAFVTAARRAHPEAAVHAAIRRDVAQRGNVVLVCPDFRSLAAVPFAFGYDVPPRLQLVSVQDFVRSPPPPPGTRVRVIVKPRVSEQDGRAMIAPVEALGLPRLYWHRRLRLYDAGDGKRLHEALRPLLAP